MTLSAQKQKELDILRLIYSKKKYPKYKFSEKPDFIIYAQQEFGIEVTEFYPDETVARLHNMPDYANKIIDNSYIHKNDKNLLEVVDAEYQDKKTGKWKKIKTKAIRQENKNIHDRLALLVKQINSKSDLYSTYNKSLLAIDLLIYDARNSLLDGINDVYTHQTLCNFLSFKTFKSSDFRNIYLAIPEAKERVSRVYQLK